MFWKVEVLLFPKIPYLFTKYAPLALCMAVSEKPEKITDIQVKSTILLVMLSEVTKSALHAKSGVVILVRQTSGALNMSHRLHFLFLPLSSLKT